VAYCLLGASATPHLPNILKLSNKRQGSFMLDIMPIIKSLWRNKTGPLLIILQLSLTIAVVSNALFVVNSRIEKIERPSGILEEQIFKIWMRRSSPDMDIQRAVERDMEIIRSTPGVFYATPISSIPLSGFGASSVVNKNLEDGLAGVSASIFQITEDGLNTLGVTLIEGRNFNANEVIYFTRDTPPAQTVTIITKEIADEMYPDESAIGKTLYLGNTPLTVIGVIERLMGSWPEADFVNNSIIIPVIIKEDSINYLVRTEETQRDQIMLSMVDRLRVVDSSRLVSDEKSLVQIKRDSYSSDYAMIKILSFVIFLLTFVNALGIFGLTTFWVNQRRKQIGIRRALGSTKAGVMRYFMLENVVLVVFAAVIGTIIAYVNSSYMARTHNMEILPVEYVLITVCFLLLVTLLAAYSPIRRAAQISPVEAVSNV
jgi:putative ABC transport system permease protein